MDTSSWKPAVAALCAALTLTLAAGCSDRSSPAHSGPAGLVPQPVLPYDAGDPATWTLPIQGYLPSDTEKAQISQAQKQLIADCMKGFGFTWSPAPDLPRIGGKTLVDWRYGIHDLALAKERGYKPEAAEQAAYDEAMHAGAALEDPGSTASQVLSGEGVTDEIGGRAVPAGGCAGAADRRIDARSVEMRTAQTISRTTFATSQQDPRVVKAFAAWSACMKSHGYSYAAPLDASDDPRFSSAEVTELERATATADIGCRRATGVAKIWFDAETALQVKAIDDNAGQLDQEHRDLDAAIREAARIVAGSR
ncbi:hypothetical protein OG552_15910 [Streptomyces sp. NBC_01476]|uniref:hypothetical protein n=1 Tax=Streptomyces sp. NBC_01476 TaxID=2903881 RepID=UPI002E366563|nr:hypothetical protein [Streptomyces sp. NBC_01476]